ncbi:bifunctional adenosylcobinamide kinase/adenosylcobinamide-phosphate guanylyltransferase [Subdoligranulum variabile]|uniref:Adenosylcobinamide kinase n=1 Tax=Subdoligranulum variabile DSM 15176 TaxID=411471 RepID=D1PMC2_9FIRM|nr:bifunctional adenosylcobinamide kinase/adenosylcobinamide-phosphate guanylyltransferase [Subdoligranulum variabile]EFB75707.1 adenosylcobinamide kinase/adenosylcobinamidephosphate guanylyltransferase [Subdoligranulum variabile DSM 15176]UWP68408.1 bifunctional adenosylcobinamide kinase/adenosylcobinamide-phosphate guanylyltransferase [Subdoligranulum variabile]
MLVLVIGGSGSGKSEYAERLTVQLADDMPRYYLATMQVWDEECRKRVEKHRHQRAGRGFVTVERTRDLAGISPAMLDNGGTILLEDLGNLAANELYAPGQSFRQAEEKILKGIENLHAVCRHLVVVSNEVGTGGADYAGETEIYLRLLGHLHQEIAKRADAVCELNAGLPIFYKGRNLL